LAVDERLPLGAAVLKRFIEGVLDRGGAGDLPPVDEVLDALVVIRRRFAPETHIAGATTAEHGLAHDAIDTGSGGFGFCRVANGQAPEIHAFGKADVAIQPEIGKQTLLVDERRARENLGIFIVDAGFVGDGASSRDFCRAVMLHQHVGVRDLPGETNIAQLVAYRPQAEIMVEQYEEAVAVGGVVIKRAGGVQVGISG
jgi:hypothetical protein